MAVRMGLLGCLHDSTLLGSALCRFLTRLLLNGGNWAA